MKMSPNMLIAIDVGGTKTQVASYDTATGALRRSRLDTHAPGLTGGPALHRLIDAAKHCAQLDDDRRLLGVAAVFPGVVRENHLLMAPNTPGLEGMDLFGELAAAFGSTAITLDNDVKAGGLAEHTWGGLRGTDHALYLNIGTGLAAAAIINGEVYRGRNGAALEIGYQLTPFLDEVEPSQWRGWRDGVAPMEALFSGASLDELARETLGSGQRAKDLFHSDQSHVKQELQRRLNALAAQLVNLSIALDVERIAIGGGVNRQYPVLEQNLAQLLQRLVPFPPALVSARFTDDAPLWGALELARRAAGLPALPDSIFDTATGTGKRHKASPFP
ncbi:glucokinase [Luteibacter rhizovicinus]|uniref:Glucokinase n=1 Tax=Luteibacter rhizovicinus TaxID=242606 RepID=A0A4V2W4Y8_9GAMM|nr:ROK family protein [Luteibacter rhizovicinus]TCV97669.1 glucokinase [Luteibacter rhizovicinus]